MPTQPSDIHDEDPYRHHGADQAAAPHMASVSFAATAAVKLGSPNRVAFEESSASGSQHSAGLASSTSGLPPLPYVR